MLDEGEGRCYLKSATQSLDTRDPLGKQFFYLLVGFAEYERQVIKERTFSGKVTRAGEGEEPRPGAALRLYEGADAGLLPGDPR